MPCARERGEDAREREGRGGEWDIEYGETDRADTRWERGFGEQGTAARTSLAREESAKNARARPREDEAELPRESRALVDAEGLLLLSRCSRLASRSVGDSRVKHFCVRIVRAESAAPTETAKEARRDRRRRAVTSTLTATPRVMPAREPSATGVKLGRTDKIFRTCQGARGWHHPVTVPNYPPCFFFAILPRRRGAGKGERKDAPRREATLTHPCCRSKS